MIVDLLIVTSPLRKYIQIPAEEAHTLDSAGAALQPALVKSDIWRKNSTWLVPLVPALVAKIEKIYTDAGISVRFKEEMWPRLEETVWQKTNNWKSYRASE